MILIIHNIIEFIHAGYEKFYHLRKWLFVFFSNYFLSANYISIVLSLCFWTQPREYIHSLSSWNIFCLEIICIGTLRVHTSDLWRRMKYVYNALRLPTAFQTCSIPGQLLIIFFFFHCMYFCCLIIRRIYWQDILNFNHINSSRVREFMYLYKYKYV